MEVLGYGVGFQGLPCRSLLLWSPFRRHSSFGSAIFDRFHLNVLNSIFFYPIECFSIKSELKLTHIKSYNFMKIFFLTSILFFYPNISDVGYHHKLCQKIKVFNRHFNYSYPPKISDLQVDWNGKFLIIFIIIILSSNPFVYSLKRVSPVSGRLRPSAAQREVEEDRRWNWRPVRRLRGHHQQDRSGERKGNTW